MFGIYMLLFALFTTLGFALLDNSKNSITFVLYTRKGHLTLTKRNLEKLDTSKKTRFLFHGYLSKSDTFRIIKDEYLRREDSNVIIADWSEDALDLYSSAISSCLKNGKRVAKLLVHLHKDHRLCLGRVHLIGHSLGAHLAGQAGRTVMKLVDRQIYRITALDASRPLFEGLGSLYEAVSKADARIVDAIHTDAGALGMRGNYGTVDFFPNGGTVQPGCDLISSTIISILDDVVEAVACSHMKSLEYFAQSINNKTFAGRKCQSYRYYKQGKCDGNVEVSMGEGYVHSCTATGTVYLTTEKCKPDSVSVETEEWWGEEEFSGNRCETNRIEKFLFSSLGLALVDEWQKHIFFILYTRKGQVNLTDSNLGEIDTQKPTKFLFHGFQSSGHSVNFVLIKDEYLKKVDCNFIIGDWSRDAKWTYAVVTGLMHKNGKRVAELIVHLHKKHGLRFSDVHLIGHSLGAQLSGVTGRTVKELVGKNIKRITALDAARPLFEGFGSFRKCINKNDAEIVDAIHTDGGKLGVEKNVGTVDFYPNGGTAVQPTCTIGCSHSMSQMYLALSINNRTFEGYKCKSWEDFKTDKCTTNVIVKMGEGYQYSKKATGSVFLKIK